MSDSIGFLMADVSRLLRRVFDERARSIGVTRPQWRVLTVLAREEGINQGMLADRLEVEPITLSRMVDRMQDAGLLERRADPDDRRAWKLYLSDNATPLIAELRTLGEILSDEALEGISDAERDALTDLLGRVRCNLTRKTPIQEGQRSHG